MILPLLRQSSVLLRSLKKTRLYLPVHNVSPSLLKLMSTETSKSAVHSDSTDKKPNPSIGAAELPKKKRGLAPNKTPISWKTLGITVVIFGVMLEVLWYLKKLRKDEMDKNKVQSIGKAAIGGEFELVNTSKRLVSSKEFLGKWVLIYFGFTHCPDICPEELEKMALVIDAIDKHAKDVALQPLFISVDPERDTPELIAKYTAEFSPRLQGLTGTIEQIKDVCKKYRIYYSAGPKEDGDYIVDHTIIMYLLNPKGEFQQYYGRNKTAPEIARDILARIRIYKE